ncbi:MAG: SDR family oxidoreductase [Chloroflexi bacterium]|nr:SDR family oxidoreductase [Chloroflexota bacterium]
MQLAGKVALVTGGGRGLGRSMALAYAREGADVSIVARTPAELEAVGAEIRALGRRAYTVNAELTTSEGANRAAQETINELGKIDILVNNVGGYRLFTNDLTHAVTVLEITEDEWRRVIESNLTTTFMTCKAVLPHMMERRSGVIVNLTSMNVARRGRAGQASYGAAKAAVERLSESLADEVKDFGIAVNILDPGWNLTRPNDDYDDEVHKRMRLPDDIAEVAVHMAMQTPATMSGQLVSAAQYDEEHGIERLSAYDRLHV